MGRADESLTESLRSLDLDPLDLTISHHLGWHYRLARQYEEAIAQLQKTLELDPQMKSVLQLVWDPHRSGKVADDNDLEVFYNDNDSDFKKLLS